MSTWRYDQLHNSSRLGYDPNWNKGGYSNLNPYTGDSVSIMNSLNVTETGSSRKYGFGDMMRDTFLGLFGMGLNIGGMFAMSAAMGGAGGGGGTKSVTALAVANQTTAQQTLANLVTSFNSNYKICGITVDANGKPSKTYAQAKADIAKELSELEAKGTKTTGTGENKKTTTAENLQNYNTLRNNILIIEQDQATVERNNTLLSTIELTGNETIFLNKDGTFNGNPENLEIFMDYLSKDEQKASDKEARIRALPQYTQAKTSAQEKINRKAELSAENEKILNKYNRDIQGALTNATNELEAADKQIGGDNSGTMKCSEYWKQREIILAKQANLGDEASFNKFLSNIQSAQITLANSQKVLDADAAVTAADNKVKNVKKNTKKSGSWISRLFKGKPADAKVARADAKAERAKAISYRDNIFTYYENTYGDG